MKAHKFVAEAVGTFILVFVGTGAVVVNGATHGSLGGLGISLVFGLVVLAMIYAIGHISGAHMNPAVTAGFFSVGRLPARELAPYWGAQFLGAVAASVVLRLLFPADATGYGLTSPSGSVLQSFVMEFLLTAILMFTVMAVATDDRAEGELAGIAIGAVIAFEALIGGPVSGASMNPARSFAPALISGRFADHWIYWVAPLLGSVFGARLYGFVRGD
jgi:aquaporin Z